jgi:hypothetical protein
MLYRVEKARNRSSLRDFIELPFLIYRNDPNWVPPLRSEVRRVLDERKNPYFANASLELFICYWDDFPVARAAVVINKRHQQKFGIKAAFFGFFESRNDTTAVRHLFAETEKYCHAQGVEVIEGPFNPNHYSELGIQISNYGTPPSFFQTYNPEYYRTLLEDAGFKISKTIFTSKNDQIKEFIRQKKYAQLQLQNGKYFTVRAFRMNAFKEDMEKVREVFNDAFDSNWHFLNVSKEEYEFSTKFLRYVTKPDLLKIVECNGEPAGVLMCIPEINPLIKDLRGRIGPLKAIRFFSNKKYIHRLVVYAVGFKKRHMRTEAYKLLYNEMIKMAEGYDSFETTWMSPDNLPAVKSAERFGMTPDKYFAIYTKKVNGVC